MSVDVEGFERELEAQRERSRAAAKFGLGEKVVDVSFSARAGKLESLHSRHHREDFSFYWLRID